MIIQISKEGYRSPTDIGTRAKIFNIFYNAKPCVQCNRCCKNEGAEFTLAMDFKEKDLLEIAAKAKNGLGSIRQVRGKSLPVLSFMEQCGFLDKGHCDVYEKRPGICRTYPIMPTRDENFWFLDKSCPAVNQLETIGVNYLYARDIICTLEELSGFISLYPQAVQNQFFIAQSIGALSSSFLAIPLLFNAIKAANLLIGNSYTIFSGLVFKVLKHNGEFVLPIGEYIKSD